MGDAFSVPFILSCAIKFLRGSYGIPCLFLEDFEFRISEYYCYCPFYHSLCWCSFCASDGCKPCTWSTSHSSQSFCSYTKHLSEDSCRSQHADLLNICHSSSLWYFLDVFYHPLLYCTKRTNDHRDHNGFHMPHFLLLLLLLLLSNKLVITDTSIIDNFLISLRPPNILLYQYQWHC